MLNKLYKKVRYQLYSWDNMLRVWLVRKILGCESFVAGCNKLTVYGTIEVEKPGWVVGVESIDEGSDSIRPALRVS